MPSRSSSPSLPRFSFSTPLTSGKENSVSTADPFHMLTTGVPSYENIAVGASDYGALIGAPPGHKYAGSPAPSISARTPPGLDAAGAQRQEENTKVSETQQEPEWLI